MGAGRKLVWTSTGAEYCVASGAWSGTRPVNGEYTIGFMSQPLPIPLSAITIKVSQLQSQLLTQVPELHKNQLFQKLARHLQVLEHKLL